LYFHVFKRHHVLDADVCHRVGVDMCRGLGLHEFRKTKVEEQIERSLPSWHECLQAARRTGRRKLVKSDFRTVCPWLAAVILARFAARNMPTQQGGLCHERPSSPPRRGRAVELGLFFQRFVRFCMTTESHSLRKRELILRIHPSATAMPASARSSAISPPELPKPTTSTRLPA
jgi:hypothetical protein